MIAILSTEESRWSFAAVRETSREISRKNSTQASKPSRDSRDPLALLFEGKKARWLPLFRRLLARFAKIAGAEVSPSLHSLHIGSVAGEIRVTSRGLELGLAFGKGSAAPVKSRRLKPSKKAPRKFTHRILISEVSDIDDELLSWVKVACVQQARTSKHRST